MGQTDEPQILKFCLEALFSNDTGDLVFYAVGIVVSKEDV